MDVKSSGPIIATRQPLTPMMSNNLPECAACHKVIRERYLLKALDQLWHEDCLKCACCDCRLGEVGSTLFTKANLILCKRDYLRYKSFETDYKRSLLSDSLMILICN